MKCPTGKKVYASYAAALSGLDEALDPNRTRRGTPDEVRVYECPLCDGWHLTSTHRMTRAGRGRGKQRRGAA